jgi:putative membrane protein
MKLIQNILVLLIVLVVLGYGILFSLYNEQTVGIDFLFLDTMSVSLSLWSGCFIVIGVTLGLLVASISRLGLGFENKRLQKELDLAKRKLEKLNH